MTELNRPRGRNSRRTVAAAVGLVLAGGFAGHAAAAEPPAPAAQTVTLLKRVVFLARREDVAAKGAPADGPAIDAARTPMLASPGAEAAIRPFIGRPISEDALQALRAAVIRHYAGLGRPFVAVLFPQQEVTNGVLQVVVLEARLGKVEIEGARWFDEDLYRRQLHLTPGGPVDGARLQADLDWLNRNPYRHATAVARAGAEKGTTDIVVRADERRPWAINLGVDNTGAKSTGLTRITAGVDWGNAFGRGDGLNYQFSGSPGTIAVRQHTLSYTTDLPWRHTLNLTASYAKIRTSDESDFGSEGVSKVALARYTMPLARRGPLTHSLALGFDYKSTDNDVLFGGESVFPTLAEVDQFTLDYVLQAPDRAGSTTVTLTLVGSPGGLTAHNDDDAFDVQRAGAKARYGYARASLSRATRLSDKASWSARLAGQLAGGTLLPSEQLGIGGVWSVRGLVEQGALRDSGITWQNDLRGPELPIGAKAAGVSVTPFWFLDAGFGIDHHQPEGAPNTWLALVSTGPGLNLQATRYVSGRLTLGTPLVRKGVTGPPLALQFALTAVF